MVRFGNVPVPFAASWSAENEFFIGPCQFASGLPAVCQPDRAGQGKPIFGKPHMVRQRQCIIEGRCDTCGRSLVGATKVSLSHARPRLGAEGLCIMQVEPLLHRTCAALSVQHCPSLKRDIASGAIEVRQVNRSRAQLAMLTGEATMEFCGVSAPGTVGHAKVELLSWKDRGLAWLGAPSTPVHPQVIGERG